MQCRALKAERSSLKREHERLTLYVTKLHGKLLPAGPIEAARIEIEIQDHDERIRAIKRRLDEIDDELVKSEVSPQANAAPERQVWCTFDDQSEECI